MQLSGKSAIVTGGASGFGEGIARKFIEMGARVMIADIDAAKATALSKSISAVAQVSDVSNADSVGQLIESAYAEFGDVDILVNNAGVGQPPIPLEKVTDRDFDRLFAVNMKSIYLTARTIVPKMKAAGKGTILNVASSAALSPRAGLNWYNASKGWVVTATKTMAVELAPNNIRVNALCPVAGETPMLQTFLGDDTPEMRTKFLSTIPLGRFSTPTDIADAAAFLCSDAASMITGVALGIDGGRCI
ncbi:MAG: glucose 1-dehydrogenase [Aestuariivita sp.]|nr:glucose 1-dehydrogenase [Aestuariivita sp.]MCY4201281.1 glucose 1-dehydrogenase [Aestuariivita sp.]